MRSQKVLPLFKNESKKSARITKLYMSKPPKKLKLTKKPLDKEMIHQNINIMDQLLLKTDAQVKKQEGSFKVLRRHITSSS